jgi:hypothetical protein
MLTSSTVAWMGGGKKKKTCLANGSLKHTFGPMILLMAMIQSVITSFPNSLCPAWNTSMAGHVGVNGVY